MAVVTPPVGLPSEAHKDVFQCGPLDAEVRRNDTARDKRGCHTCQHRTVPLDRDPLATLLHAGHLG